ncbi:YbaY family lipoprotein [Kushneria phosphatilytica]|uniref:Uncharacterized protein n=1 Tax=Kushneria phosphatilytica TaxID=657387 RepID=A0A1S1NSS3_9GAMM|nr:YbaY family lipoprotein [Kushneria phosphatilytica]OHV08663.1 hypothetical protein BH688_11530 [Kushneria phosphatilytica]QEL12378.1 hypothetical protein FY550_15355 [Kushneria phosphatilytica]
MHRRHIGNRLALLFIAMTMSGCSLFGSSQQLQTVSGQLTTDTATTLPASATVEVRLIEVGNAHATLATTELPSPGRFPIDYQLRYASDIHQTDHQYMLDATIRVNGQVRYLNEHPVSLPTNDQSGQVRDIPMVPVNHSGA